MPPLEEPSVTGRPTHPPIDPQLQAVLDAYPGLSASILPRHISRLRADPPAPGPGDEALRRGGAVAVAERRVPLGAGAGASLLVLTPAAAAAPPPAVYYLHGGGMILGDNRTGLDLVAGWVVELGLAVASFDYRLAPEHPHPVPVEDSYAGLVWLHEHADELGIRSDRLMVAGSSAGGGIAAAVALMARDRGGPPISDQLLFSPMLDDRNLSASSHELDGEGTWDRRSNITGWDALLGDARGGDGVSEYAAPARARDLSRLPPTYLDVGAIETFRDEVLDFGMRLAGDGVPVELHLWAGAVHGFDALAPDSDVAVAARRARVDYLRRRLRQ